MQQKLRLMLQKRDKKRVHDLSAPSSLGALPAYKSDTPLKDHQRNKLILPSGVNGSGLCLRSEPGAASIVLPTVQGPYPRLEIIQNKPHLLTVWELLRTNAPNPTICQPYCCYVRTVIFYIRPYTVRPFHRFSRKPGGGYWVTKPGSIFEQWDQIEYALGWDDPIEYNGERFETGGGRVIWRGKRWWMRHWARRKKEAS